MKIFTDFLRQISLCFVLFFVFSLSSFGAEETYSYTFTSKQFAGNGNKTLGGINWMLSGTKGSYWGYDGTKGQQFGSGSSPYKSMILSTSDIEGTITEIEINTSGASSVNASFKVSVGGVQYGTNTKLTSTATSYTFRGSSSGMIKFEYTQTSSKAIYIKSISVTYSIQAVQKYKVTFDAGSGSCPTTELEDVIITLPIATPSDECQFAGWKFAGWSETKVEENATEVTLLSNQYEPTKDCTLYAVYSKDEESVGEGAESWKLTDIANIESTDEVVITMTNSSGTYALTNGGGTSKAPVATKVEVLSDALTNLPSENLIWNISSGSEDYNIYPNGITNKWLYCINDNNGVRVGDNENKTFKIDGNYLYNIGQERYLGVYNNQDWRCYSTINANIQNQTLGFYVKIIEFGTIITTIYNSNPDCADIEEHTITFGDIAIETVDGRIANIPELPDACNAEYSTKVGWSAMSTFGVAAEQPEVIDENTIFIKDTQLYPVYSGEVEKEVSAWLLVKDASTLAVGDNIVIAAKESDYALSTTQNTNNRAQASVYKNGDFITFDSDVQVITLLNGEKIGSFAFFVGTGNLYAASSSSNHLKTRSGINDDASWSISIESDGTATVKAQGENTRNLLRYNAANNPPIFSCYASGQNDICIYKKSIVTTTSTEYYICGYETVESGDVYEVEDNFALNTITLKSNYDQAAQINVIAGSLTAQKVIVEKTIDAFRYYFFSLPFKCKITDIEAFNVTALTTPLMYCDDYTIFYYDQVKAANNKGAMGSKAWVEITDTAATLKANQGYIIGYLLKEGIATIKFKSSDAQTISAPADTILNIDDYEWYTDGGVATANGWNLIGMPYYQKPNNGSLSADINVYYATMPNDDGKTYTQTTFANANIAPFTSFFVQTKVAPTFTISAQQNAAPKLTDGRANHASQQKAVISFVDANGAKDQTTIINNPNTTADYEIGYDLVKWIGYAAIPQIYSIQGDDILAFNSLAIDNSTVIPLGVYAHADGEYTFSLDTKSVGDLQGWELYDNEEGKTIRLANEILTVYLEKGKHEGRFELRLQQRVATDCDTAMSNMQTWVENGKLNIDNMPVDARVYIYDAVGRMLYADNEVSESFSYDLPGRGVYSIVVSSAVETIAFKTIY